MQFHVTATPPRATRKPSESTWHGITLADDYAWLRAANWQEVMRDPAVLDPEIRAYLEAENAYTEARLADTADAAGRSVQGDEGAHQGGRQLRPHAGRRLGLLHELRHRRAVPARLPAAARRRRPRPCCSTATPKPRARPTGSWARSPTAPTTGCSPTPSTTRARRRTRSASATSRPATTSPTRCPTRAAASSGPPTAARCSISASTTTYRPLEVWRHVVGTPAADDVLVYSEDDAGFYVGVGQTQSGRFLSDRRARPPDDRGAPDRRRQRPPRRRARRCPAVRPRVQRRAPRRPADHHHQHGRRGGLQDLHGAGRGARHWPTGAISSRTSPAA